MWLESLELVEINRPERRIAARGESEFKLGPLTMIWDMTLSATHWVMIWTGKSYKEVCWDQSPAPQSTLSGLAFSLTHPSWPLHLYRRLTPGCWSVLSRGPRREGPRLSEVAGDQSPGSLVLADGASNVLSPGLCHNSPPRLPCRARPLLWPPTLPQPKSLLLLSWSWRLEAPGRGCSSKPRCLSGVGEVQLLLTLGPCCLLCASLFPYLGKVIRKRWQRWE